MHVVDIHCLQHYTFVPVHPLPAGMENPLQRKEEENTVYHMDRGNGTAVRGRGGVKWCKEKGNTNRLNQGWTGAALNQRERSWEATFPWIYSRSSIWRAALAACVSKEWIQHIINNWCASKHWRYAHMMRMYTFFSWMMHSLAESRQSADNFGQMKYYVFLFGHSCHYTQLDHCAGGRKERIQKWVMKRHVSNL